MMCLLCLTTRRPGLSRHLHSKCSPVRFRPPVDLGPSRLLLATSSITSSSAIGRSTTGPISTSSRNSATVIAVTGVWDPDAVLDRAGFDAIIQTPFKVAHLFKTRNECSLHTPHDAVVRRRSRPRGVLIAVAPLRVCARCLARRARLLVRRPASASDCLLRARGSPFAASA